VNKTANDSIILKFKNNDQHLMWSSH